MTKRGSLNLTDAYALLHEATPLFVTLRQRGVKLDMDRLRSLKADTAKKIKAKEAWLVATKAVQQYQRRYGKSWRWSAASDQRRLFFEVLKLPKVKLTSSGQKAKESGDGVSLDQYAIDADVTSKLLETTRKKCGVKSEGYLLLKGCNQLGHLAKIVSICDQFDSLQTDGYLHPGFWLHTTTSYRSSSSDPNFQNVPKREESLAILRTLLVPRFDWLVECDFKGCEICGYGVCTLDKQLVHDLVKGIDFHRRYAAMLYEKAEDEISDKERFTGKNQFVFAEFYGSWWRSVVNANPQWSERAVQGAENALWADMPNVRAWQKRTEDEYLKTGRIKTLTGFELLYGKEGCLSHAQCCNLPNQGFSFHRMLAALLRIERTMRRNDMRSMAIGQIHDSIVSDVTDGELQAVIQLQDKAVRKPVWGFDKVVPWRAEFAVGRNLGVMEKVA